ncbi:MAG: PAS domain S-box protein [Ilumatobacter sp.]|nr:PAS domain S-box protein [Ilumatobacter sp.]
MAAAPDTAMLLHAVERAPDGVLIVDESGTIVYANRAMLGMSGYPDLEGRNVDELVPVALRGQHVGVRNRYMHDPTQRPMGAGLELALQRADGREVPVEISLSPFEHNGRYVVTAVRDVSDRQEAQRRLSVAHEQLALVGERERIGRDLHDVVLQHLYGMGLTVQAISAAAPDKVSARLDEVVDDVDRIISEVRTIVFTLGSTGTRGALGQELADVVAQASRVLGFTPALRLEGPVDSVLTNEIRTEMIASMREALGNVARHAKASEAAVLVTVDDGSVVMTVVDDGVGPPADAATVQAGHGLKNLHSRAAGFGGTCTLGPRRGAPGAELRWTVPF